ncbi:MAG: cysteine hydrolase family protein [Candidatus Hodarchaeota archaeon]
MIIIDVQLGNFTGSDPIYNGDKLLERISKIVKKFRSRGFLTIYIQNMGNKGDPDQPETPGWRIHPDIAPLETEITIQKTTPDSFYKTNLQKKLNSLSINHLYIVGLQTEYCVDTTVRRAFSFGFRVTLIKDAHSTWDSPDLKAIEIINHHNRVLGNWFAEIKNSDEINI